MASPPEAPRTAREVERSVLERIRPDAALVARLEVVRAHLVAAGARAAADAGLPLVRCLVAGSAARGTFLRDRVDLDFFLLFDPSLPRPELERAGLALGAAILTAPARRYAEHPYLRGTFEGFTVDAVPGYAIDDPSHPLTAVDRTPFHQAFLAARQTPAMVDEVRLTKQFLRGIGVYGSEARRGGFSGYLVELLVLRFGTLDALLAEARAWRAPVRLLSRPGAAARAPEEVALLLDDPVDAERNVASALTRQNLGRFVVASGRYLDAPSAAAFDLPPGPSLARAAAEARIRERGSHVTGLRRPRPDVVDDILYPQMRKAEGAIGDEARRLGFAVLGTASAADATSVLLLLEVERAERSPVERRKGPPPGLDRAGEFLAKWTDPAAPVVQGPYVAADGELAVEIRRTETALEPLLTRALERMPLGRDLRAGLDGAAGFQPLAQLPDGDPLAEALAELLAKGLPGHVPAGRAPP